MSRPGEAKGPLQGVRVLDLTRLLPGGFATAMLADLGAEVIKVEQPGQGDYMRWDDPKIGAESAHNWTNDRNKKSIALDLKDPRAVEALKKLAETADVIFEGFRPGVVDRLGVGYEAMKEVNPKIVYCSLTGYGQDGPLVKEPGHDLNYAARAGITSITGPADGVPTLIGVQIADLGGGALISITGILAALYRAATTGEGDYVDVAMTDGAFAWTSIWMGDHFATGEVPKAGEMMLNGASPCYQVYECSDGKFLTVAAVEEQFFAELCEVIGRPELASTQFETDQIPMWREIFREKTRDEWLELFVGHDVCVGPVNDFAEAAADPQLNHREMIVELEREGHGTFKQIGNPIKLREHPAEIRTASPRLGEHTAEILTEAGLSQDEITYLTP
ncbi:MAG: CoA transferase [Solirubrobacterales bacterium]|nr:CoA transferase [Solirubrobacterales bacterium]